VAARRTPTSSNEREPETSPWSTDPPPFPVRLAVGDQNDGELATELAAEFAIEMCVSKKRLGVTCEPVGWRGAESSEGTAPRSPPASAVHDEWAFLRPAPAAVRTATNRVTSPSPWPLYDTRKQNVDVVWCAPSRSNLHATTERLSSSSRTTWFAVISEISEDEDAPIQQL